MSELYTNSRLATVRDCLRKHFYRYVLNIRTPSSPAMEFGTVCHAALEAYLIAWKASGQHKDRIDDALITINQSTLSEVDKVKLRALLAAYDLRWGGEPWEIVAVEVQFRYELGGYVIGGKIDAIIRDTRDGRIWLLEHKTTRQDATPGSVYWERLSIDSQISIYVDGATMLGHEIAGCIYDVIKRPQHEPLAATPADKRKFTLGKGCKGCGGSAGGKAGIVQGRGFYTVAGPGEEPKQIACEQCSGTGWKNDDKGKPEAPRLHATQRAEDETLDEFSDRLIDEVAADVGAFLIRGVVVRLDDELPRMRQDMLDAIKMERAAALLYDTPPRNPDACAKYGTLCSFFGACSGRASIDDQHMFPRGVAHPELANAA